MRTAGLLHSPEILRTSSEVPTVLWDDADPSDSLLRLLLGGEVVRTLLLLGALCVATVTRAVADEEPGKPRPLQLEVVVVSRCVQVIGSAPDLRPRMSVKLELTDSTGVCATTVALVGSGSQFLGSFGTRHQPVPPGTYRLTATFAPRDEPRSIQLYARGWSLDPLVTETPVTVGDDADARSRLASDTEFRRAFAERLRAVFDDGTVTDAEVAALDDLRASWGRRYCIASDVRVDWLTASVVGELRARRDLPETKALVQVVAQALGH